MITILKRINVVLIVGISILLIAGLIVMALGKEQLSKDILFFASGVFPFLLGSKGVEFMVENQLMKAFLSILTLSLVCLMLIIFVFV